jgi:Factor for inversion stimulation Fis, transcriptional activator
MGGRMTMMTETLVSGTTPVSDNVNLKQHLNTPSEEGQTLRGSVEKALHNYFAHLEGAEVTDVYNLVLSEVEAPLLECVMNYVKGNQTKASELLGLNRGTLRKKTQTVRSAVSIQSNLKGVPVKRVAFFADSFAFDGNRDDRSDYPPADPPRFNQRFRQNRNP